MSCFHRVAAGGPDCVRDGRFGMASTRVNRRGVPTPIGTAVDPFGNGGVALRRLFTPVGPHWGCA